MAINDKPEKVNKGVTFKSDIKKDEEQVVEDTDDNLSDSITLLEKTFGKFMRRLDIISRNIVAANVKDNQPPNSKGFGSQCKGIEGDKPNKGKVVHFHEWKGFGYILEECANFVRKEKKGYTGTLSDEESEEESDLEEANNAFAFIANVRFKPND